MVRDRCRKEILQNYERRFVRLKAEIQDLGYVLQGSVTERRMECGKPACRCHDDLKARHGPYYQWSWKTRGRTASVYLDEIQSVLCKQWIRNHRRFEQILKRMRALSLRVARLYQITIK